MNRKELKTGLFYFLFGAGLAVWLHFALEGKISILGGKLADILVTFANKYVTFIPMQNRVIVVTVTLVVLFYFVMIMIALIFGARHEEKVDEHNQQ